MACPGSNGQTYTDGTGTQYTIGCGADTTNGNYEVYQVTDTGSINDCIALCSANYHTAGTCTAFSWVGDTTGNGAGTCYFKSFASESFTQSDSAHIGVIRLANYVPGSYIPGSDSSTSSSSSTVNSGNSNAVTYTEPGYVYRISRGPINPCG